MTIHPHGIFYAQEMDGAYKGKYTDPGGFVQPGEEFTYIWDARPGTEGIWLYHDHGPMDPIPLYKGLMGPLIIRDPAKPRPDVEYFIFMHALQPVATTSAAVRVHERPRLRGQHADARVEGGRPGRVPRHRARQRLPHVPHPRPPLGGPGRDVIDTKTMGPGDSFTLEFVEDNPGRWFYHCHVFSHLHMGMNGWYLVS